jgi:hypothetical protein
LKAGSTLGEGPGGAGHDRRQAGHHAFGERRQIRRRHPLQPLLVGREEDFDPHGGRQPREIGIDAAAPERLGERDRRGAMLDQVAFQEARIRRDHGVALALGRS